MPFIPKNNLKKKIFKKKKNQFNIIKKKKINSSLISINYGKIRYFHLELIRRFLIKSMKKKGKIQCNFSLNVMSTKKNSQSRMGKGVGKLNFWFSFITPGKILFNILNYNYLILNNLRKNIKKLNKKLPINCIIIIKNKFFKLLQNDNKINNKINIKIIKKK